MKNHPPSISKIFYWIGLSVDIWSKEILDINVNQRIEIIEVSDRLLMVLSVAQPVTFADLPVLHENWSFPNSRSDLMLSLLKAMVCKCGWVLSVTSSCLGQKTGDKSPLRFLSGARAPFFQQFPFAKDLSHSIVASSPPIK